MQRGKWTLNIEGAKGKYYAKVGHEGRKEFENLEQYFHIHKCHSAKSRNVKSSTNEGPSRGRK